jgi:hypothetical protein
VIVVALAGAALAGTRCVPLDEDELRRLVLASQEALDRDDSTTHASIVDEAYARVACLTFAPPPRLWADLLVGVAIARFYRHEDWESPMAAALRAHPSVDRGVGGGHPLATFDPPPVEGTGGLAPEGVDLWVDGIETHTLPAPDGLHLVQRHEGRFWSTRIVQDAAVDPDWLTDRMELPPHLATWGTVSLQVGGGSARQVPDWPSDYITFHKQGSGTGGFAATAAATFWSPFGIGLDVSLPGSTKTLGAHASGVALWSHRGLDLGVGGGLVAIDVWEGTGDGAWRPVPLPYLLVSAETRLGARARWNLGASAGAGRAVTRFDGRAGYAFPTDKRIQWRVAGDFSRADASFEQPGFTDPEHLVASRNQRFMVQFGFDWGEY